MFMWCCKGVEETLILHNRSGLTISVVQKCFSLSSHPSYVLLHVYYVTLTMFYEAKIIHTHCNGKFI